MIVTCNYSFLSSILTLISLKTTVPHKEAIIDGPVVTIGNATGIDKDLLATNQQLVATDHIIPGSIAFGYILKIETIKFLNKQIHCIITSSMFFYLN